MDYNLLVAANLRRQRNILHMTLEMAARQAGISPNYLGDLEHARKSPTVRTLVKIASSYGISPAELFDPADFEAVTYLFTDLGVS